MEKSSSSPSSSPRGGSSSSSSCWGCLKLKLLPWRKRAWSHRPVGGFKYDPLSYAQNFDEGWDHDDEISTRAAFSTRYAAPNSSTITK